MFGFGAQQQFGPVTLQRLRAAEREEVREERERAALAETLAADRRAQATVAFLEEHPEFEDQFRADIVRNVTPGLTVSQRCAMVGAAMDAEDRRLEREREQRTARRRSAAMAHWPGRTHADTLALIAASEPWEALHG
jgi:hypothetical protein